jgi:hypothetical protein
MRVSVFTVFYLNLQIICCSLRKSFIPPCKSGVLRLEKHHSARAKWREIKISAGPPCRSLPAAARSPLGACERGNRQSPRSAASECCLRIRGPSAAPLVRGGASASCDHVTVDAVRNGGRSPICWRFSPFSLSSGGEIVRNRVQGALERSAERIPTPAAACQRCSARIASDTPGVSTRFGCCRTKNH